MTERVTYEKGTAVSLTADPKPSLIMNLTPEEARRVAVAQNHGVNLTALLRGVIARLPQGGSGEPSVAEDEYLHPGMTFAEILAPMREDFKATGMTDEELGEFVDETVARVRARRRAQGLVEEPQESEGEPPVRLTDENGRS